MKDNTFLFGIELRPITLAKTSLQPIGLALGPGASGLEVVVATSSSRPTDASVRAAWHARNKGRAAPLLLVVLHDSQSLICGPQGEEPPVYEADRGQAERLCREALCQTDRHAAIRCLRDALPTIETRLPGIRNEGFLATHELEVGARELPQWEAAMAAAGRVIGQRDEALLASLGYRIERCDGVTSILRTAGDDKKVAIAVLLQQNESPELQADRFSKMSPVSYALAVANRENVPYVIVQQGGKLRIYPARLRIGVGQRGPTETYVELHTGFLRDSDLAYLWLLFSADALRDGGTLELLLNESKRFAGMLAENLRERIYESVVPTLATGLANARGLRRPTARDLAETYEMAMTVLFRLLFIAYGEDKDLLPYRWNEQYRTRSLKQKARELVEIANTNTQFDNNESLWEECRLLFHAVDEGHNAWGIPAYNGGLFSRNPSESPVGAALDDLRLPNAIMGPVLSGLLVTATPEGLGPVDFRSLGVREFGTIYEGLLESELAVAETDLALDDKGFYRPARKDEEPVVRRSHIYLHNRSGARKSSGSYFTKSFAVEHLLEHALEPALADHLNRLKALDTDAAAERLFDFRVADIAMGSGHFLVAAVDHIERAFSRYLADRPLAGVRAELARLHHAAKSELERLSLADQVEIEDTQLLRRLIARRCIYGVDLNPVAVQLARVSIWIHTFVPGLPLSLLDHNLVVGNSLVGIGTVQEIRDKANEDELELFQMDVEHLVGDAMGPLTKLARIADATLADVGKAREAYQKALEATQPAEALCDIVTGYRVTGDSLPEEFERWEEEKDRVIGSKLRKNARKALAGLEPFHFPVAFPEVFLRDRSGFDVILGNPPWEEATLEEHAFWARQEPGLRGLNQRQQEHLKNELRKKRSDLVAIYQSELAEADALRKALVAGPFPGMGTGDPDLYKAFCWRFWHLIAREGGRLGVVLPRSAWNAKGTTEFRISVFKQAESLDLTMLVNNRQWVFPEVHPQYSIGLTCIYRGEGMPTVRLRGPFASLARFQEGIGRMAATFPAAEVMTWTDTASLPLLPTEQSLEVFARLRAHPRLDLDDGKSWRARPHREMDATNDKKLMDVDSESKPRGFWPVYKGESFDIWESDRGQYYAWADPDVVVPHLQKKRLKGKKLRSSVYFEFQTERTSSWWTNPETLPCYEARIAFRDVTRATDQRTVRLALVPPKVFIANSAPFLLWPRGGESDEAYLLAILSSLPLDWYSRRFVETHVNFFVLNPFPVPRPKAGDPLHDAAVKLAGRLAAPDKQFAKWAKAVGVEYGPLDVHEKFQMICELDAVVAHLYGLEERHLRHIFETFHEGWQSGAAATHSTLGDYDQRFHTTMQHFKAWTHRRPTLYQKMKPLIDAAEKSN